MEVEPALTSEARNVDSMSRLSCLHRDLASGDRKTKCQAIEGIRLLVADDPSCLPEIVPTLYQLFSDRFEVVRERAVRLMADFSRNENLAEAFSRAGEPDWYCIETRLAASKTREPAEEVRTQLLELVGSLLSRRSEQTRRVFSDSVAASLAAGLIDACPATRRLVCETVTALGRDLACLPHAAAPLFPPLIAALKHQHVRVRAAAVAALGVVVCYSDLKEVDAMYVPLAQMLFDPCAAARRSLAETAALLLTEWHSRYSHFHRLLPIMLSALTDDPELSTRAWQLWSAVGVKFLDENPDEDSAFLKPPERYPEGVERPNQGCRLLVSNHVSKILAPLAGDLKDWKPEVRLKSAELLTTLMIHSEHLATQHLAKIAAILVANSNDTDEPRVSQQVELSAGYVALFVSAELVANVVLPLLAPLELHAGHLRVLAALLENAPLASRGPYLEFLARPTTADTRDAQCQRQVLRCCQPLLEFPDAEATLFCVLATLLGLAAEPAIHEKVCDTLSGLSAATGSSRPELLKRNVPPLVARLVLSVDSWTRHSTEWLTLAALVGLEDYDLSELFSCTEQVFRSVLSRPNESELHLQALVALAKLLASEKLSPDQASLIVNDLLTPALSWSAGRAAEAVRAAAMAALLEALRSTALPDSALPALAPLVAAGLGEAGHLRSIGLACVAIMARRLTEQPSPEIVSTLYPGLARLLDAEEGLRLAAVRALTALLVPLPNTDCSGIRDAALDRLLLHLDDPKPSVHVAVLDALKSLGLRHREEIRVKLEARAPLMRNRAGVQALDEFLREDPPSSVDQREH